ncbi:MAG TPA: hypothetical protein VFB12_00345 [Ktedonobacteraceae bacterium]|nr:hypothetical protein [Ktedonobacteraceae bacterium]
MVYFEDKGTAADGRVTGEHQVSDPEKRPKRRPQERPESGRPQGYAPTIPAALE